MSVLETMARKAFDLVTHDARATASAGTTPKIACVIPRGEDAGGIPFVAAVTRSHPVFGPCSARADGEFHGDGQTTFQRFEGIDA